MFLRILATFLGHAYHISLSISFGCFLVVKVIPPPHVHVCHLFLHDVILLLLLPETDTFEKTRESKAKREGVGTIIIFAVLPPLLVIFFWVVD